MAGWSTGAVAAFAAAVSLAQPPSKYQVVESGTDDVSPLRVGSRILPTDLRVPTGFEKVYRIPGAASGVPGIDHADDKFARISGAVTAVFPRSEYLKTRKGATFAAIPAGTVFYIGGVPESALGKPAAGSTMLVPNAASMRVNGVAGSEHNVGMMDLRLRTEADDGDAFVKVPTRADATLPPDNVMVNDTYRRQRLRAMLMEAVRARAAAE